MSDVTTELHEDGVFLVTLNRPEQQNAITDGLRDAFSAALAEAAADPKVRVVAVTGAGRAFCAGADLHAAMERRTSTETPTLLGRVQSMDAFHDTFAAGLYELEKPTVALINGAVAGAGFGMALSADFRIAASSAIFVSAFARIALPGDSGITYGLQRLVGRSKALEILMLSPRLDAAEAERLGIVREVVPDDQLMTVGMEFCGRLAAGPIGNFALMKANMAATEISSYQDSLRLEALTTMIAQSSGESAEAIQAFLDKREPKFG